jgi:hypothetical protein
MREHRLLSGKPKAVQFMFKLASHRWFDNFIILVRGKDAFSDRDVRSLILHALSSMCGVPYLASRLDSRPLAARACCPTVVVVVPTGCRT